MMAVRRAQNAALQRGASPSSASRPLIQPASFQPRNSSLRSPAPRLPRRLGPGQHGAPRPKAGQHYANGIAAVHPRERHSGDCIGSAGLGFQAQRYPAPDSLKIHPYRTVALRKTRHSNVKRDKFSEEIDSENAHQSFLSGEKARW